MSRWTCISCGTIEPFIASGDGVIFLDQETSKYLKEIWDFANKTT